jgi:hypothetical protein
MRSRQLPMAVLINSGSASASEITAAALRDANRAAIVGQRSAGAVASSEILPLPSGAGLQIAVAAATASTSAEALDGAGVTPDVNTTATRTLDDYRAGRDPQVDAAVAALARAPAPPGPVVQNTTLSAAALDGLLGSVIPDTVPGDARLKNGARWQRMDFTHPNELIDQNGGAPDPDALQQTLRVRGYQGSVMATYGSSPGDVPSVTVEADLYATADGAHSAVSTNDLPVLQTPIDSPASEGDETVAYQGTWLAAGSTEVVWRRGRLVLTVTYSDVPGQGTPDSMATLAQLVDERVQQITLP